MKINTYKNELILLAVSIVMCFFFFNNHCNLTTDFGREVLIPVEILNGKVLYKDILNIYPPLSYYINAIAVFIFGKNLNTFFLMGSLNCIIFTFCFYYLALNFLNKKLSLFTTLLVVFYCMYGFGLYNFQHPYSCGITYGLTAYIISVLFFSKFIKEKNRNYLYISSLFSGLSVCCKIEFLPLIFINAIFLFCHKKQSVKNVIVYLIFCLIPFICFLFPYIQGMTLPDTTKTIDLIVKETTAPSVKYFYKLAGTYFSFSQILSAFLNTIIAFFILGLLYLINLKFDNKKIILFLLTIPLFIAGLILFNGKEFGILPLILLAALIVLLIKKDDNFLLKYIIFAGLGASLKTLYSTDITLYGTYTLPLMFLALTAIINKNNNEIKEKFTTYAIVFLILIKIIPIITLYREYNCEIKTDRGNIKTSKEWAEITSDYLDFVKNNTNKTDKILHLQEGVLFNFLADRETNMKIYALNAPYIETYGQITIIKNLSDFKYITIIDGMGNYYFGKSNFYFGKNEITDYIKTHYETIYVKTSNKDKIILLKRIT